MMNGESREKRFTGVRFSLFRTEFLGSIAHHVLKKSIRSTCGGRLSASQNQPVLEKIFRGGSCGEWTLGPVAALLKLKTFLET